MPSCENSQMIHSPVRTWGTFGQRDWRLVEQMWSYGRTICKRNGLRRDPTDGKEIFSVHPWNGRRADQIVSIGWEWALIRCLGKGRYRKGAIYADCTIVRVKRGRNLGGAHTWSGVDPQNQESFLEGKWKSGSLESREFSRRGKSKFRKQDKRENFGKTPCFRIISNKSE